MSKVPFMPLWVGDFLAKTSGLDAKEAGAYLLLLMGMWMHGGSLPADQKKLQRVARVGRDWPKVWGAISQYFSVDGGRVYNERLSLEWQKACTKREVNAHAGARGGRAKALKSKDEPLANATVSLKQSEPYSERKKEDGDDSARDPFEEILLAVGHDPAKEWRPALAGQDATACVAAWRAAGLTQTEILRTITETMANKRDGPPSTLRYFNGPMAKARDLKANPPALPAPFSAIHGDQQNGRPSRHDRANADFLAGIERAARRRA